MQLHIEKTTAEENFTRVSNEKELLLKELDAKTDSISQLESLVEQLRGNQPDAVKLLATMESDKVAASVAIQQNKELKQQLEGMQEVVMKLVSVVILVRIVQQLIVFISEQRQSRANREFKSSATN